MAYGAVECARIAVPGTELAHDADMRCTELVYGGHVRGRVCAVRDRARAVVSPRMAQALAEWSSRGPTPDNRCLHTLAHTFPQLPAHPCTLSHFVCSSVTKHGK
eukprot:1930671-Rhodomonas_salina.1